MAPVPVRHFPTAGDAVDAIKARGPVEVLTLAAGQLAEPCRTGQHEW